MPPRCGANSVLFFSCPELTGAQATQDACKGMNAVGYLLQGRRLSIKSSTPAQRGRCLPKQEYPTGKQVAPSSRYSAIETNYSCAPKPPPNVSRSLSANTPISSGLNSFPKLPSPDLTQVPPPVWRPIIKGFRERQSESYSLLPSPAILLLNRRSLCFMLTSLEQVTNRPCEPRDSRPLPV